jgi:hypothetical protein
MAPLFSISTLTTASFCWLRWYLKSYELSSPLDRKLFTVTSVEYLHICYLEWPACCWLMKWYIETVTKESAQSGHTFAGLTLLRGLNSVENCSSHTTLVKQLAPQNLTHLSYSTIREGTPQGAVLCNMNLNCELKPVSKSPPPPGLLQTYNSIKLSTQILQLSYFLIYTMHMRE